MSRRRKFLTAQWRKPAMFNYKVEPDLLKPFLPQGTQLDLFQGQAFLSVVGFLFLDTRVFGVPVPLHRNFEELNLRFYVRRETTDEVKRGVVFIKEIVPRWAIATLARWAYNENYISLPMRHSTASENQAIYQWQFAGRWNQLEIQGYGEPAPAQPDSLEEFITEHYWGYCAQRDGGTIEYHVEHPPWNLWPAEHAELDCDVAAFYGRQFGPVLKQSPASALLADGSPIIVNRPNRLEL